MQNAVVVFLLNAETEIQNVDSYKLFRSGLFYKEYAGEQLRFFYFHECLFHKWCNNPFTNEIEYLHGFIQDIHLTLRLWYSRWDFWSRGSFHLWPLDFLWLVTWFLIKRPLLRMRFGSAHGPDDPGAMLLGSWTVPQEDKPSWSLHACPMWIIPREEWKKSSPLYVWEENFHHGTPGDLQTHTLQLVLWTKGELQMPISGILPTDGLQSAGWLDTIICFA